MLSFKALIFITFLLAITISQRGGGGGGGGGSRSRSSKSSSSSSTSKSKYRSSSSSAAAKIRRLQCQNSCLKNSTATDVQKQLCVKACNEIDFTILGWLLWIGCGIGGFFGLGFIYEIFIKQIKIKWDLVQQVKKEHRNNCTQFQIALFEEEQIIIKLLEANYKLIINHGNKEQYSSEFDIKIEKCEKWLYLINFNINDSVGKSNCSGYLSINKNNCRLWFLKQYQNKSNAGQTGDWRYLIYDGILENGQINSGRWYFKGYQNSDSYSGKWRMKKYNKNQKKNK